MALLLWGGACSSPCKPCCPPPTPTVECDWPELCGGPGTVDWFVLRILPPHSWTGVLIGGIKSRAEVATSCCVECRVLG